MKNTLLVVALIMALASIQPLRAGPQDTKSADQIKSSTTDTKPEEGGTSLKDKTEIAANTPQDAEIKEPPKSGKNAKNSEKEYAPVPAARGPRTLRLRIPWFK